jgi:AraC-like DNA-binding protein
VRSAVGYTEWAAGPVVRRDYPSSKVVVVIEFGPPIGVAERDDGRRMARFPGGFVAGLDDAAGLTEHDGFQSGMRLDLTPQGARRLFGVPMSELTGCVIALADLLPRAHRDLCERLRDLSNWDSRFDLLERVFSERLAASESRDQAVSWAAERIEESGGTVNIQEVVRRLGYSHKHTLRLFREHVGMTPKLFARLVRFDCMRQAIARERPASFAELAARLGYSDQAHLVREVQHFAGTPPSALRVETDEILKQLAP